MTIHRFGSILTGIGRFLGSLGFIRLRRNLIIEKRRYEMLIQAPFRPRIVEPDDTREAASSFNRAESAKVWKQQRMSGCNLRKAIRMQRKPYLVSRRPQVVCIASIGRPALSVWQSAVLAYVSAKCGSTFTSIKQTKEWLRINPEDPQHLTIKAVCGLLLVEPPKRVNTLPPASPPTAA